MDPNLNNFPILSYVMSKIPSIGPRRGGDGPGFDVEMPPSPSPGSPSTFSEVKEPVFDLTDRMPRLTDPKVIASMRSSVSEVAKTRAVVRTLGERPDHESVDNAKAKLAEIEASLSKQLEEVVLSPRPTEVDRLEWRAHLADKEKKYRDAAEKERQMYKAVIALDELHASYEKMLTEAEKKLENIYESAVAGRDFEEVNLASVQEEVEEVNEDVVKILQDSSGMEIQRIDLSNRRLRFLPEEFGRFGQLLVLNLFSNQLQAVPDSIGGLTKLEELNLSSNLLETLPDSIGLLLNLKVLNASSNKLVCLPDSICGCRALVELDASFNRITYLPTNIGHELVNLQRLSIQLNKIRTLPTSLGDMRCLRILDAHFNELRGLPNTIGRLSNLEILNLSSNFSDLTELPETIGELTNLKEVDLSNNQIHALPDSFGRLDNITKLNLEENPLVVPPKEVVREGVEAVKVFMAKRWLDILVEEEERSAIEMREETENTGVMSRSSSWLKTYATSLSGKFVGYLGNIGKSPIDASLDQQL